MPRKTVSLLTIITLMSVSISYAQERTRAEDILRYFPEGIYSAIHHQDDAMFETTVYKQHSEYVEKHFPGKRDHSIVLPYHLVSKDLSETMAALTTIRIVKDYIDIGEEDVNAYNEAIRKWEKQKYKDGYFLLTSAPDDKAPKKEGKMAVIAVLSETRPLYVYRFDDLEGLLGQYISVGGFKKSGFSLQGNPIWTDQRSRYGRHEEAADYYYCATANSELLVAESIEHLKMM